MCKNLLPSESGSSSDTYCTRSSVDVRHITVWAADVPSKYANGYFTILKNAAKDDDWGKKENIAGQDCAYANNYNDRKFPENMSESLNLRFGTCGTVSRESGIWQL